MMNEYTKNEFVLMAARAINKNIVNFVNDFIGQMVAAGELNRDESMGLIRLLSGGGSYSGDFITEIIKNTDKTKIEEQRDAKEQAYIAANQIWRNHWNDKISKIVKNSKSVNKLMDLVQAGLMQSR